jgi:hypothetical protein
MEQALDGGNVSRPVSRVGDTVRKPSGGPWTKAVDSQEQPPLDTEGLDRVGQLMPDLHLPS